MIEDFAEGIWEWREANAAHDLVEAEEEAGVVGVVVEELDFAEAVDEPGEVSSWSRRDLVDGGLDEERVD